MLGTLETSSKLSKYDKAPVTTALKQARMGFIGVAVFSFVVNLFMLTGPLFMLQVYDRVLTSRSIPTLVALYILIVALFAFMGLFSFLRTRILSRIGYRMDQSLMGSAEKARIVGALFGNKAMSPVADLTRIRQFIASPGQLALFDLPWTPIYLAAVFYMHPMLGWLTLGGIGLITLLTLTNEIFTRKSIAESTLWDMEAGRFSDMAQRNAEAIISMGMMRNSIHFWKKLRLGGMVRQQKAGNLSEWLTSISRTFRLLLQSSILGLGAYYAVFGIITPGTMIAASIIGGRALAPIDQAIGSWKAFIGARQSRKRLNALLAGKGEGEEMLQLPPPTGQLVVSGLVKMAPRSAGGDEGRPILQGVGFSLNPGDALGVVGPSASGKSSLAKLLVGLWMPDRGAVRLDGATFDQWDNDELGQYIGYLPQSVDLMRGSIRDNIARFNPEASDEDVVAAAKLANVHDLILALPGGYGAEIGGDRVVLSGGQVQRIALARALFGNPVLVVLDEPNSNLDAEGDAALTLAIHTIRQAGSTVIVMAHRPSAIAAVNKLLMLRDGAQVDFGDKEEVLQRITRAANDGLDPTTPQVVK
jgi:ATP-binding cassette subfamily C exporter for protease/lipase